MSQTKHGCQRSRRCLHIFLSCNARRTISRDGFDIKVPVNFDVVTFVLSEHIPQPRLWRTDTHGKLDSFSDRERREMLIIFWAINDITAIVFTNFPGSECSILDVAMYTMECFMLV